MRLGVAAAAVLSAAFLAILATAALIPADTVRNAVLSDIRAATGLDPTIRGAVSVSLFPTAMVSFSDVVLDDERGATPALAAERLTAKLRLLPLLIGQIEPADLSLTNPRIAVRVEADGRSNWSRLLGTLARTLKPGAKEAERPMSVSELRLNGGTITITEASRDIAQELSNVEMAFAWPSIARSFGATGRFTWRGDVFDASANTADLLAALSGDRTGLKVRLAGAPFKLAFDGHMSQRPSLKLEGTLALDGKSLREAAFWINRSELPEGGFGPFSLKAQMNMTGGTTVLSGMNMELDGNVAEGVLALTGEPRATVKGTLASDLLNLTPYLSTVEILRSNSRDWSRRPLRVDQLSDFDLDLRLSAARMTVGTMRFGRTAATSNLRDGRFTLSVVEAQACGGTMKGTLVVAKAGPGVEMKSQAQLADVEMESCLGEMFGIRKLEGRGNLSLAVEATGESVLDLTRTLAGTAELTARQGGIVGVNIEQLLKRLEQRPLSIAADFRRGRTPFDKLTATFKIAQGTATVEDVTVEGGAVRLGLAGSTSIAARDLDLKGTAALVAATADATPLFELPFVVQGPWDDPILLPDAQSLIRRSGAAAPLLDAIRDRKTRDAVRSAIDQLQRDGIVAPGSRP